MANCLKDDLNDTLSMPPILLNMKGIIKSFPGVNALKGVNFKSYQGKVTALLGENGAGKSTLMKILSGIYEADKGEIIYKGEKVNFRNTRQSASAGIAIIHQELNLIPNLSIAENIFLGREPLKNGFLIDKKELYRRSKELLEKFDIDISPDIQLGQLSVGVQQMIEIAKAFSTDADLFIMDEPTASLTDKDVERLFSIMKRLKNEGKSFIYISHRLDEIFEICDYVTVLRDGELISERLVKETKEDQLIEDIVSRKMEDQYPYISGAKKEKVISFKNISSDKLKGCSGEFYSGQTTGVSGLVGSGRTELAKAIFGASHFSGDVYFNGRKVTITSPQDALKYGIVYLSEDRKGDGLILDMSVRKNATLSFLSNLAGKLGLINKAKELQLVENYIDILNIITPSTEQKVGNLSGGNQQKVALARALIIKPKVLFLDEPTRGIDIGAKKEIYDLINKLKGEGLAVIMISSDMNEILGMSDTIMVMCEGEITGTIERSEATSEKVMKFAVGIEKIATK